MGEPKEVVGSVDGAVASVDELLNAPKAKTVSRPGRFRRVLSAIRKPVLIVGVAAAGLVGGTVVGTEYSEGIRDWAAGVERSYDFWTADGNCDIVDKFREKAALYNTYGEQRAADSLRDKVCGVVNLDGNYECRRIK